MMQPLHHRCTSSQALHAIYKGRVTIVWGSLLNLNSNETEVWGSDLDLGGPSTLSSGVGIITLLPWDLPHPDDHDSYIVG